jgi:orotate phosphoribosyltransferase
MAVTFELDEIEASVLDAIKKRALHTGRDFRLSSGKTSRYFLDMKAVLTDGSDTLRKVAELMLRRIPEDTTAVGGLAMGAIPIATEIVSQNNTTRPNRPLHFFWVRAEQKSHGLGGVVSGTLFPGDRVVIVDDVTTEGNSAMKAITAAREAGAKILKVLTIVDREEGASATFKGSGLAFEPLFTKSQVLGH